MRGGSDVWDKVPNKSVFFTPSLMMIIHKGCTKNIRYNCLKRYDEHWRPVSVQCSLCNFPFTHILHFESLQVGDQSDGVDVDVADVGVGDFLVLVFVSQCSSITTRPRKGFF